jgi:hypothetical protein
LIARSQVGFERSATRDDVRVTLSLETLEEARDAGSVTRVNSNSHVSKVCWNSPLCRAVLMSRTIVAFVHVRGRIKRLKYLTSGRVSWMRRQGRRHRHTRCKRRLVTMAAGDVRRAACHAMRIDSLQGPRSADQRQHGRERAEAQGLQVCFHPFNPPTAIMTRTRFTQLPRVFLSDRSKGSGEDKMRAPFY